MTNPLRRAGAVFRTLWAPWAAVPALGLELANLFQRGMPWRGEGMWTIDWFAISLFIVGPAAAGVAAVDAARLTRPGSGRLRHPVVAGLVAAGTAFVLSYLIGGASDGTGFRLLQVGAATVSRLGLNRILPGSEGRYARSWVIRSSDVESCELVAAPWTLHLAGRAWARCRFGRGAGSSIRSHHGAGGGDGRGWRRCVVAAPARS